MLPMTILRFLKRWFEFAGLYALVGVALDAFMPDLATQSPGERLFMAFALGFVLTGINAAVAALARPAESRHALDRP